MAPVYDSSERDELSSSDADSDSAMELAEFSDEEKGVFPVHSTNLKSTEPAGTQSESSKQEPWKFSWHTGVAALMLVLIWGVVVFIGCISWDKVEPDLRLSLGWLLVSSPLCLWDSGYQIARPRSFAGEDLHWIWKPYVYYANVDFMYGRQKYDLHDGLPLSIAYMDVLESVVNFLVVYFAFRQHNSLALVVGLIVSTATFWKTVLYFVQDMFSGFQSTKQDTRTQYWLVYFLPNIWWILFPGYIMVFFASKLIVLLP